ncbi:chorismate-binding protein [Salinicoccus luteus]|uniref:chorismate-binding protein n=1 Tax=Salinicoccus luteus TaxID=367840 RepID=UPI00069250F4|nr:chorismate-binding protein [Salinicoccus luteus]
MQVHVKFKKAGRTEEFYFTEPVEVMTEQYMSLDEALERAQHHAEGARYVIPALSYEAKEGGPFIIGVFEAPVDRAAFLKDYDGDGVYMMGEPVFTEPPGKIMADIEKIRNSIKDGHTYQVNYTTRLKGTFSGDAHALFEQLIAKNNGDYTMFIHWKGRAIVSCSPELFFEVDAAGKISTRPMKGTARRYDDPVRDQESFEFLKHSGKDRAENVMIVDLLRNDLSKVARKGSVHVPERFTIEHYDTVYQMTSTVEAELAEGTGLPDVIEALFPCGSITGAPKQSTMEIIRELERTPRGFYCGTLGIMHPDGSQVFNVPIRTLYIEGGRYEYGTGGGITYDSIPESEYDEMVAKTAFLEDGRYKLIETMRLESGTVRRFGLHEKRVLKSARALAFSPPDFRSEVMSYIEKHGLNGMDDICRLRAVADAAGRLTLSHGEVEDMSHADARLAEGPINASPMFLTNKTTVRHHYHSVSDDFPIVLYYNEYQQLTEFNIGNLVVEEDGEFHTPPVTSGLLDGVMRQCLMAQGILTERDYSLESFLEKYENGSIKIYLINSLKEWVGINLNIPG